LIKYVLKQRIFYKLHTANHRQTGWFFFIKANKYILSKYVNHTGVVKWQKKFFIKRSVLSVKQT
jgi:hypothetical protein